MNAPETLYTIGHSNYTFEQFLELVRGHDIEVIADVRSAPYSRWVPHFNKRELERALEENGVRYVYLGRELGGRPDNPEFLDDEGHALYYKMAQTPEFHSGIERLREGIKQHRVAVMCAEEDPTVCHRTLLVGRVLRREYGVTVRHIRGDGRVTESEAQPEQRSLFDGLGQTSGEDREWKSTRSVSPARAPKSSSESSESTESSG